MFVFFGCFLLASIARAQPKPGDIFSAEFYFLRDLDESAIQVVLYGDGRGNFTEQTLSDDIGAHEGKLVDLDNDEDLDILQKDFQEERVDFWINEGTRPGDVYLSGQTE